VRQPLQELDHLVALAVQEIDNLRRVSHISV
jgi:hypothetical protein